MKYKLVALDLDGTLLNDDNYISEYTKSILLKLVKKGIYVVIATGRSYSSVKPKIQDLKLGHPVICYNGAMIRDGHNDEILLETAVPDTISREMIKISRRENIHFQGFINGEFHYEKESESSSFYQELSGLNGQIINFDNLDSLNFTKCMFIGHRDSLVTLEKSLKTDYNDRCYIAFSKPTFLEIMNIKASKAKALEKLATDLNIDIEDIIAFGDGMNDEDMLDFVGKGIIMKNGHESLKLKFENTTYTNNQDGVAKYLEGLLDE